MSGESLQEWRYNADLAGISSEELSTSLKFFTKSLSDAAMTGKGPMADSLNILGIKLKKTDGSMKDSNTILLEMADKLKGIQDPALRAKISTDIFGRSGIRMAQLLGQGSDAINAFSQEARDLGLIISEETLAATEELDDNITRLQSGFKGVTNILGNALLPIVNKFVIKLTDLFKKIQKDFKGIIEGLANSLSPLFDTVLSLLEPVFNLLNPLLKITSNLLNLLSKVLNNSLLPFINTLIKMLVPILNDFNTILSDLFIMLEPALNSILQIAILIIKSFINPAIIKLKIMMAILQPIIKILSTVFKPMFFVLDKILGVVNILVDKFMFLFDNVIKNGIAWFQNLDWVRNLTKGFEDLFGNIQQFFLNIINSVIDGINFLILKMNGIAKTKISLLDRFTPDKILGGATTNNNQKQTNINLQNNIKINGINDANSLKKTLEKSAGTIFNLELKKLSIESGGL